MWKRKFCIQIYILCKVLKLILPDPRGKFMGPDTVQKFSTILDHLFLLFIFFYLPHYFHFILPLLVSKYTTQMQLMYCCVLLLYFLLPSNAIIINYKNGTQAKIESLYSTQGISLGMKIKYYFCHLWNFLVESRKSSTFT